MRITSPPRAWTKPSPSATNSVWPWVWWRQAVWAQGVKCTDPIDPGDESDLAGEPVRVGGHGVLLMSL